MRKYHLKDKIAKRTLKLCSGFSLLDEKDQEHIFGLLQALLFAKLNREVNKNSSFQSKGDS